MDMTLPAAVKAVLDEYDASDRGFHEHDLAQAIGKAAGPAEGRSEIERHGVWAEISAFNFMPSSGPDGSVWESYFAPLMTATRQDGTEIRNPDIAQADSSVIGYWARRSGEVHHPILRARYADLVWDFTRLVSGDRPPIASARQAIDAYNDAINQEVYFNEAQAEDFAQRALILAVSINDKSRIAKAKKAIFTLYSLIGDVQKRGLWWLPFDNLYSLKQADLTPNEQEKIIEGLEQVLQVTTDEKGGSVDPFAAQGAAERLERHYRRIGQQADIHRVILAYGKAFETAAEKANPLLAVAWLQPIFEKYHDVGLKDDAARLQRVLETRGPQAQAGMQRVEVPVKVSLEDMEKYADALTAGDQRQALGQIGMSFLSRIDELQAFNERMRAYAPISTLFPIRRFEVGHVAAIIGSQSEDPDGRLINQIANRIGFEMPWLAIALEKAKTRHGLDADKIWTVLSESPLFAEEQRVLVTDGLTAWLSGDHVKAIHVLIPQIERAVRNLAGFIGVPITGRGRTKGTMQIRGLGEILYDDLFAQLVDENLRKYLLAFLADQRGINLRNRVAHGLLEHSQMAQGLSDRLVHILLALSCLEAKDTPTE